MGLNYFYTIFPVAFSLFQLSNLLSTSPENCHDISFNLENYYIDFFDCEECMN